MLVKPSDLQNKLDLGGNVDLPDGAIVYLDRTLVIRRSGTRLRGRATLVLPPQCFYDAIALAGPQPGGVPADVVTDVEIEGLTLDGGFNGQQPPNAPNYFGLFAWNVDYLDVSRCTFRNWFYDGVSVGTGTHKPSFIDISGCRFVHCRRNGLHLGSIKEAGRILRNRFAHCPSQHWEPAAGNAIDLEPESTYEPGEVRINDVTIQDNYMEAPSAPVSSGGITVQSIRNETDIQAVRIVGNVAVRYQGPFGLSNAYPSPEGFSIRECLVQDNVGVFPADTKVQVACGSSFGTDGVRVVGNRFYGALGFPHRGWKIKYAINGEYTDNLAVGQPMLLDTED